jgi:hypothetical protein
MTGNLNILTKQLLLRSQEYGWDPRFGKTLILDSGVKKTLDPWSTTLVSDVNPTEPTVFARNPCAQRSKQNATTILEIF